MKLKLALAAAAFTAVLTTGTAVMTASASTAPGHDGPRIEQTENAAHSVIKANGPGCSPTRSTTTASRRASLSAR